jgi:methanogen homoisocitrate dehydrogenase
MIKIATIPGDGIGKEVLKAGLYILDYFDLNFEYTPAPAGRECFNKTGETIPDETIKIAKNADATLFGAITSTPGEKSPIVTLRKELDTYGNIRPIKSFKGVDCIYDDLDFVIVRENTEGLYSQSEEIIEEDEYVIANKIITKKASERICKLAFNLAVKEGRKSVVASHKANVLRKTDGLFRDTFYEVAEDYPNIETNDYYVDATSMFLVTQPQNFDVIVAGNLYGDILSDESAGLVGGLGLAPSGNIGDKHGLFEPVHGSAPDIAGKDISNPIAMLLSTSMMLDYLSFDYEADLLKRACEEVLRKGNVLTPDLGGTAKTYEMADAVVCNIRELEKSD